MTTISIIIENPIKEDNYSISDKSSISTHFLNKKRYKSDDDNIETTSEFKTNKKISFFTSNKNNKLEIFLRSYDRIIKENKNFFQKEESRYKEINFNQSLINYVIKYFSLMKFYLRKIYIFKEKELIDLIKTFHMNDLEFSVLTLLLEEFLSTSLYIFQKENIYYLGLYSKYISSDDYKDIFHKMINSDKYFNEWFLHYNQFLKARDLNIIRVNKRNNFFTKKEQKFETINYNLMAENIFQLKKENENKIFCKNYISHNIGKKVNVVVVYQDKNLENIYNIDQMEKIDSTNNDIEGSQTDISA
jgi:hypothetical protein